LSRLGQWSSEDQRQFASVAAEFTHFLRNHMRFEQQQVFEPARERLSAPTLASLAAALARFDADNGSTPEAAQQRLDDLLLRYESDVSATA
jgi:hemerythrin-like domain-containing protein